MTLVSVSDVVKKYCQTRDHSFGYQRIGTVELGKNKICPSWNNTREIEYKNYDFVNIE